MKTPSNHAFGSQLKIVKPSVSFFFMLLFIASSTFAADETNAPPRKPGDYPLGPDSLPQEGVPRGKLEGPFLFHSQIFTNTVRKYWLFIPAQYTPDKPACVLVFQDGQRATRTNGSLRV